MISEASRRAWWLAVGPRLERGVRPRRRRDAEPAVLMSKLIAGGYCCDVDLQPDIDHEGRRSAAGVACCNGAPFLRLRPYAAQAERLRLCQVIAPVDKHSAATEL